MYAQEEIADHAQAISLLFMATLFFWSSVRPISLAIFEVGAPVVISVIVRSILV
jgi:hypothetical protein